MTALAGSVAVEVVADLSSLDAGLKRAESASSRAAGKIAGDLSRVERAASNSNSATGRLAASYAQVGASAGSASSATGRMAAANDNVARSANEASFAVKALVGALALINAGALIALGTATAKVGMEMTALQRGFAAAAGSAQQGGRELTFVKTEADRLGLSIAETSKQYMQMLAASQGTAMQGQATRDIFVAVATAMTALGKSSSDTGGALLAVQQMMSKGAVQSEELKGQLGERLPGAFNLAAAAMGKTTTEFQKMLEDGDILASDLLPKLAAKLIETYGAAAKAGANDLGANLNRLSNAWRELSDTVAQGGLNAALNTATQALTRFLETADGASVGRTLGASIEWLVQALERIPRGFENLQIGLSIIGDLARAFENLTTTMVPAGDALSGIGTLIGEAFSSAVGYVTTAIDGVIGVSVAGYQMVAAAWQALPGVFGELSAAAGNALIAGIEAAVNLAIAALNKLIASVNAVGGMLPDAVGFKQLAPLAEASFGRIESAAAGSAGRVASEFQKIGREAMGRSYLSEAGKAVSDAVDGQIQKFRILRADQDASNHLLREAGKIAKDQKVADAYNNVAKAGKAAGAGAKDAAGGAKEAASAYENLIQRTKDRIEELELEAQYASKTATEVIKLKLAHDLERAAKKDGLTVTEAMRAEWDKLGDALAAATQKMEAARLAQRQLKQGFDFAADAWKSFAEDLLTGTDGLNGALKSLGKSFLSSSLDALISGKGGLAGLTGLAPMTKDGQGGLLGMIATIGKDVQKGAEKGTATGTVTGFSTVAANDNFNLLGGLGIDGKQLAGGLTAIAGLAGAYGAGMSAGSVGQAIGGGAISGGMAGMALAGSGLIAGSLGSAAVLGPIGAIVGAGLAYFGNMQAKKQQREAREAEAQANYKQAAPGIATLRSQLRGESQDTLENRIKATLAEVQKGIDVAFLAKKTDEAKALADDYSTYLYKSIGDFQRAFGGIIDSMLDGLGPNSAFSAARENVKQTGDVLKGLISDAAYAFGEGAVQIQQAREAALTHALSILDGSKSLSMVATRMEEIRGAGAALQTLLVELGMSATDAAEAIQKDTIAALDRLKVAFRTDLESKINDAEGAGYINEVITLLKEVSQLRLDAGALGMDASLVERYFKAAAQEIVDGAQLTGDAFDRLLGAFPDLVGNVSEFTGALKGAAREADIAARRLAFLDRVFAATNDTSTLEGQLAAYDRNALREREAELKKGGEALAELEMAQQAERFNIVRDWNQKILDDQKRAADDAKSYFERFTRQIREYVDGLRAGSNSPLSPQARLEAATSQFNSQYAMAQGGNRDALNGITSYSGDLLEAARAYWGSSEQYQAIFQQIIGKLEALPQTLSAEQFIVNAIEAGATSTVTAIDMMKASLKTAVDSGSAQQVALALSTYFNRIDTNTSQTIDFAEMQAALGGMASNSQLRDMFTRLDTDNSGSISRLEAIKGASDSTTRAVDDQDQLLAAIQSFTQSTNLNALSIANAAEIQKSLLSSINQLTASQGSLLAVANTSAAQQEFFLNKAWENLRSANSRFFSGGNSLPVQQYATGGYVSGPGTATSDSIMARLSNGEFVMRAAAVQRLGVGTLSAMNENRPVAASVPGMGGPSQAALIAEIRALRAELSAVKEAVNGTTRATIEGAVHVRDGVDGIAEAAGAGTRKARRAA